MAAAAAGPLDPPAHLTLRPGDRPFWDGIVLSRARETWDDHDLAMAAALARCMADVEKLQEELDREGHVIRNNKGTPIANPKHAVIETLTRRIVGLSRTLQIHALAKNGDSRDQGKGLKKQREAGQLLDHADEDLIPRAPAH
jgi:hypothetical protein